MAKFKVYEYDFAYRKKLTEEFFVYDSLREAMLFAKKLAKEWCQDESPVYHYNGNLKLHSFVGDADFGVIIIEEE